MSKRFQQDNIKQIVFSPKYAWNNQAWTVLLNEHQGSWKDIPETLILKIIELQYLILVVEQQKEIGTLKIVFFLIIQKHFRLQILIH